MRTLALALLAATACEEPQPVLDVEIRGCAGIRLDVREAVLPDQDVEALVADRVQGDTAWVVTRHQDLTLWLKASHGDAAHPLETLDATLLRLVPGSRDAETWLVFDHPDYPRVWRLGESTAGEVTEVPDLGGWPGPGTWTRRLLFIGDTPHLLAAPRTALPERIELKLVALDREALTLRATYTIDITPRCRDDETGELYLCNLVMNHDDPVTLQILDVIEAGRMAGGAALVGINALAPPTGEKTYFPIYRTVILHRDGDDRPPQVHGSPGWHVIAKGPAQLFGQMATDGNLLFRLTDNLLGEVRGGPQLFFDVIGRDSEEFAIWDLPQGDMLLQIGERAVLGNLDDGRWTLAPLRGTRLETDAGGSITLPAGARITSAGREQLLVRPKHGPALRVVATCEASP